MREALSGDPPGVLASEAGRLHNNLFVYPAMGSAIQGNQDNPRARSGAMNPHLMLDRSSGVSNKLPGLHIFGLTVLGEPRHPPRP